MSLDLHPWWQEAGRWWLWSPDDLLLRGGDVSHRNGEVRHASEAVAGVDGVRVTHRSGRDLPTPAGDDWFDGSTVVPVDDQGPATTFGRRRTEGAVLTRDLACRAQPVTGRGSYVLDGRTSDPGGWPGIRLTTSGIDAPDLRPGPDARPLDALPDRLDLLALIPTSTGTVCVVVEQAGGQRAGWWHGPGAELGRAIGETRFEWEPGTRQARAIELSTGDGVVILRPVRVLPVALVGGLGSSWPIGGWVGDAAVRRTQVAAGSHLGGLAGVEHEYLCVVEGLPGASRAIVVLTALGPQAASGLRGWTDPA